MRENGDNKMLVKQLMEIFEGKAETRGQSSG
jgi:hypothetical protein